MQVLCTIMDVQALGPQYRPIVCELSLCCTFGSPFLEFVLKFTATFGCCVNLEVTAVVLLPVCPLRLAFLDDMDKRFTKSALSKC